MTRKSVTERNEKRKKRVALAKNRRDELIAIARNRSPDFDPMVRLEAALKLDKMHKDTAAVRIRRRCNLTGRPRGVYRKFGLCRIKIRDLMNECAIPGLIKSGF